MPGRSNGLLRVGTGILGSPNELDVGRLDEPTPHLAAAPPLYLVKKIPIVGHTELVVTPVPMTVNSRLKLEVIAKHPRVADLNVPIMVGTEQSHVHDHSPYLLPRADCWLGHRHAFEPCIVRASMIIEIVVPV